MTVADSNGMEHIMDNAEFLTDNAENLIDNAEISIRNSKITNKRNQILELLKKYGACNSKFLSETMGISIRRVQELLKEMIENGYIKSEGLHPNKKYLLNTNMSAKKQYNSVPLGSVNNFVDF